jgi:hypothetical protein
MSKVRNALNELVELLEKGQAVRGKTPLLEDLSPHRFWRKTTYDHKPIDLHAKGKKLTRELSDMEIWHAISK